MPKEYTINGRPIHLYEISEVGREIGRDALTLRKWERKGIIPKPLFTFKGRRLYTRGQIDLLVKMRKECRLKRGRPVAGTAFSHFVFRNWGGENVVRRGDETVQGECAT